MNLNDTIKQFKRDLARHSLFFISWLINKLPYGIVSGFTHFLIAFGYRVAVRQRRIADESLTIAFGAEKVKSIVSPKTVTAY